MNGPPQGGGTPRGPSKCSGRKDGCWAGEEAEAGGHLHCDRAGELGRSQGGSFTDGEEGQVAGLQLGSQLREE